MGTTPSEAVVPVIAKSASPMSFTFSLKVTRHVRVFALVGEVVGSWRTIEVTVGAVVSATDAVWLIDTCIAAVLPLPAASSATFAATFSVTVPVATGVIVAVKVRLSLEGFCRFEGAPLPTVMSPIAKPVTASSKVKVAVNGPVLVDAAVIVTVGAVLSSTKKLSFVPLVGVTFTSALPAGSVMFWPVAKVSVTVSFRSFRSPPPTPTTNSVTDLGCTRNEAVVPLTTKSSVPGPGLVKGSASLKVTDHCRLFALVGVVVGTSRSIFSTVGAVLSTTKVKSFVPVGAVSVRLLFAMSLMS